MNQPSNAAPAASANATAGSDTRALVFLTGAAIIWGAHAVAGQIAVGQIQPLLLVFLRWALVGSVLWVIYGRQVRDHWPSIRPTIWTTALAATIGYTSFNTLFYFASERTTGLNVGILQGTIPIFVLAGAAMFQKTPATVIQMAGAAIAFVGLVLVTSRGDPGVLLSMNLNSGDALMLLACSFYAIYTLSLKNRPQVPGTVFFTVMALCAAVSALPFLVFEAVTTGIRMPTATGWMVLLFVAIFPSCLAQLFFLWGVDRVGPGRAGMFANLVPVCAALLAVLVLGEQFRWFHGAALVLVVGGIWLVQTVKSPAPKQDTQEG